MADRGVDAVCNVLCFPLESTLLGDGTATARASLVDAINARLRDSAVRVFSVFRTTRGYNAKQFCALRTYEMLVPAPALRRPQAAAAAAARADYAVSQMLLCETEDVYQMMVKFLPTKVSVACSISLFSYLF